MMLLDKLLYAGSGFNVAVAVMAMGQGDASGVAFCLVVAYGMWRLANYQPRGWKGE